MYLSVNVNNKTLIYSLKQIGQFRGIEYSASVADFFDDINMRPAEKWHPKIPNVVYWGKLIWIGLGLS